MKQRFYGALSSLGVSRSMRWLRRGELVIVMYHGFTDREQGRGLENFEGLHEHVDEFRRHLEHLRDNYRVITLDSALDALERQEALPERAAVITMDDGYRSNHRLAFPLLREFDMPASIFLATDFVDNGQYLWTDRVEHALNEAEEAAVRALAASLGVEYGPADAIGARGRFLRQVKAILKAIPQQGRADRVSEIEVQLGHALQTSDRVPDIYEPLAWEEVREMLESGLVSIGSHSHSHFILANCEEDVIEQEVSRARSTIEQHAGISCDLFCYPNGAVGDFDGRTQKIVRAVGHSCALTTVVGSNPAGADRFTLKRVGVMNADTLIDFEMALCGATKFVGGAGSALRWLGLRK